jgi:PAS domain S-box-containing protein
MTHASDSEARLAAIVAYSDDAIISKDLNGRITSWNIAAERLFGYTAEEAIGQSITLIIPIERLSEETEVITRIRAGLTVEHYETVRQRKDGQMVDISLTVSPILRDGVVIGASKIARDITEQRRLRAMGEEASRLKDEFLAVLSHELRTPLNTVLGYARMLRREDKRMTEPQRERALDALERNADSLSRLVGDILDTSRIVTGKLRLALTDTPLDEVIELALDTIRPAADAKGIAIEATLHTGLHVLADRDRLVQVLWNLLSNAIKFTPSGGRIRVRGEVRPGSVALSVEDTGVGMTKEQLPHVFQRFWQGDAGTSREFAGLGIGLALARHLVELHGGEIAARSDGPGRGSIFTVSLPHGVRTGQKSLR